MRSKYAGPVGVSTRRNVIRRRDSVDHLPSSTHLSLLLYYLVLYLLCTPLRRCRMESLTEPFPNILDTSTYFYGTLGVSLPDTLRIEGGNKEDYTGSLVRDAGRPTLDRRLNSSTLLESETPPIPREVVGSKGRCVPSKVHINL